MSPIVFGESLPCPDCEGTGNGPLNANERARELRRAKRLREKPPEITYPPCEYCRGTGLVNEKGKYK